MVYYMYTTHQPHSSMGTAPGRENGAPRLDEDGTAISFDRADERALKMMAGHTAMFMSQLS